MIETIKRMLVLMVKPRGDAQCSWKLIWRPLERPVLECTHHTEEGQAERMREI